MARTEEHLNLIIFLAINYFLGILKVFIRERKDPRHFFFAVIDIKNTERHLKVLKKRNHLYLIGLGVNGLDVTLQKQAQLMVAAEEVLESVSVSPDYRRNNEPQEHHISIEILLNLQ